MSENDQQLISDHREVLDTIRRFDKIRIISTSGNPINEYNLEYKVKGYTIGKNGKPTFASRHQIRISLSFGYPYFHPVVKPLTRIYHPDVDENVMGIAHFWETNRSLAQLVVHIGEMICGACSDKGNSFNDEAAAFYRDNAEKLPLDSIENDPSPQPAETEAKMGLTFLSPLLKIVFLLAIIALLSFGVVFYLDNSKLKEVEGLTIQAETDVKNLFYDDAQKNAEEALSKLHGIRMLKKGQAKAKTRIETLLNSREMQEGLQGKIQFNGNFLDIDTVHKLELLKELGENGSNQELGGNTDEAIRQYEEAIAFAQKNNLHHGLESIKRNLARLKLQKLFSGAEQASQNKNRENAIHDYQQAIDYITKNINFVQDANQQLSRAQNALILEKMSLYLQNATDAERNNDLKTALNQYDSLIHMIQKTKVKKTPALQKALNKALAKKGQLSKDVRIKTLSDWLLAHYKIFFQVYYPMVVPDALKDPKTQFLGYNEDETKLVFSINCIDTTSGSVVRLHMNIQYTLETEEWNVIQDSQ